MVTAVLTRSAVVSTLLISATLVLAVQSRPAGTPTTTGTTTTTAPATGTTVTFSGPLGPLVCDKCTEVPPSYISAGRKYHFDLGTPGSVQDLATRPMTSYGEILTWKSNGSVEIMIDATIEKRNGPLSLYLADLKTGEVKAEYDLWAKNGDLDKTVTTEIDSFQLFVSPRRGLTKIGFSTPIVLSSALPQPTAPDRKY